MPAFAGAGRTSRTRRDLCVLHDREKLVERYRSGAEEKHAVNRICGEDADKDIIESHEHWCRHRTDSLLEVCSNPATRVAGKFWAHRQGKFLLTRWVNTSMQSYREPHSARTVDLGVHSGSSRDAAGSDLLVVDEELYLSRS